MKNKIFIFDLDDTLYKEIDFLYSAYREIAGWIELKFSLKGIRYYDKDEMEITGNIDAIGFDER